MRKNLLFFAAVAHMGMPAANTASPAVEMPFLDTVFTAETTSAVVDQPAQDEQLTRLEAALAPSGNPLFHHRCCGPPK